MYGSDFIGRCNILANKFKNFIEKNDLEYSYYDKYSKCNVYYNKNNGIYFNHDFLKTEPFEDTYEIVKEKYERRINRLLNKINKSNSVLVVYFEKSPDQNSLEKWKNHNISNKEIIMGYTTLKAAFGNKINLLYLSRDNKNNLIEYFERGKITKIYTDLKMHGNLNIESLKPVFSKYELNLEEHNRLLNILMKNILKTIKIMRALIT